MDINCSVTVMLFYEGKIGFIKRSKGDSYPELFVAPGGTIEFSDGVLIDGVPYFSVEKAAIREIIEEVGIFLDIPQLKYFCSLTLPNGRLVISMYAELSDRQFSMANDELYFLSLPEIRKRSSDFAPGMREEAELLICALYDNPAYVDYLRRS